MNILITGASRGIGKAIAELCIKNSCNVFAVGRNEELLKQRIVVMYEVGETTYLDILLNSKDLVDFLSNYYIIAKCIKVFFLINM